MEVQSSTLSKKKEQIKDIINFSTVISYLCAWKGKDGRKPVVSFCNRPFSRDIEVISSSNSKRTRISISSFMVPYVLVASFLYPQFILPEIIPKISGN